MKHNGNWFAEEQVSVLTTALRKSILPVPSWAIYPSPCLRRKMAQTFISVALLILSKSCLFPVLHFTFYEITYNSKPVKTVLPRDYSRTRHFIILECSYKQTKERNLVFPLQFQSAVFAFSIKKSACTRSFLSETCFCRNINFGFYIFPPILFLPPKGTIHPSLSAKMQ